MPVSKNAAFRYRIIDSCLRNPRHRFPSIENIQKTVTDALDLDSYISLSSLHKDLKAMREHYKAPILYNKAQGGYYYDDDNFSINAFPLTIDEITALDLSVSFLKQIKYSGFFTEFESAIEKIISGFRISKIEGFEKRRFLETEEPTADTGIRWLETLYRATVMREAVTVQYRKFNSPEARNHTVSPYLLREYRNRWYVTGHTALTDGLVTLALDRILDIRTSEERFVETPSFDQEAFVWHAFGVTTYPDATPAKVQLLIAPSQRGYIESKPIHKSQTMREDPEGVIVEMECYMTPELEMFILSLGEHVKVRGPIELSERVKRRIEAMKYLYL